MPAEETTQQSSSSTPDQREETGYYHAYAEFAKTLRTWFIAYGIGAPALVLSNKDLWNTVKGSGNLIYIAALFLLGAEFEPGVNGRDARVTERADVFRIRPPVWPALDPGGALLRVGERSAGDRKRGRSGQNSLPHGRDLQRCFR